METGIALRFYSAIVFLLLIPLLAYTVAPSASLASVLVIPIVLIGAEVVVPHWSVDLREGNGTAYRLLPLLYAPLQLAVTGWAIWYASRPGMGVFTFTSLVLSVGIMMGIFGAMAGHELIHSHDRLEKGLGVALLTAMSYRHFSVAHIYGHHRYAATDRDPTSARLGESFYAFVPRAVAGQLALAWSHERQRTRGLANRVVQDALVMALVCSVILFVAGPHGLLFFVLQSAAAIVALELFNYVAHYGLIRKAGEPFTDRHSWNASHAVCNAVLFNMGRHSDHHRHASVEYQTLRPIAETPELPAGYAGAMLLALIPPLWRKLMDPRVLQLRPQPVE